ncbi:hypothetical protein SAMN05444274_102204 [Mariniphaga anaerophila]|uniref:Uncharacterized protein n=1 Tax=Mariniphaga anaerophila TaxID=1484053 RepID=A0A1M4VTM4_9BACT|nr:hypothetical protein [Mariniphaga anaerophila]SHE72215.1 hypothetical protein SAMN05444274_102204 [Mariniphaga anaerophila]
MDREVENTYQCNCSRDAFCSYVMGREDIAASEKDRLAQLVLNNHLAFSLYVCVSLTFWSIFVFWIDLIAMPGLTIYVGYVTNSLKIAALIPVLFFVLNFIAKFVYIYCRLNRLIPLWAITAAALPYVGFVFILREQFRKDPELKSIVIDYLKFKKEIKTRELKQYVARFIGRKS